MNCKLKNGDIIYLYEENKPHKQFTVVNIGLYQDKSLIAGIELEDELGNISFHYLYDIVDLIKSADIFFSDELFTIEDKRRMYDQIQAERFQNLLKAIKY